MQYKFNKGLVKGLVAVVCFGLPLLIQAFPVYADLTIGAVLIMLVNYLKVKFS